MAEIVSIINGILANPGPYKPVLAVIKGFRNGIVYGTKIRAPHSFVMTFLFRDGSIVDKLKLILKATANHARSLAFFALIYKSLRAILTQSTMYKPLCIFISSFVSGYMVFGEKTPVNNQIILYLISRIIVGLVNLSMKKSIVPRPTFPAFPLVAATAWGLVLLLFEYERDVLQDSLRASLEYLYEDSNVWHNLKDFIWHNK